VHKLFSKAFSGEHKWVPESWLCEQFTAQAARSCCEDVFRKKHGFGLDHDGFGFLVFAGF
jgi:hypothetical protein